MCCNQTPFILPPDTKQQETRQANTKYYNTETQTETRNGTVEHFPVHNFGGLKGEESSGCIFCLELTAIGVTIRHHHLATRQVGTPQTIGAVTEMSTIIQSLPDNMTLDNMTFA